MAFGISGHKWLRLFALALGLYILLLPIWWYLLGAIAALTGASASLIYSLFNAHVGFKPRDRVIQFVVDGKLQTSGLRIDLVTYGWPMLIALVAVTRSSSMVVRLRALAIGIAVMFAMTVGAVMAWAKMTGSQQEQQAGASANESSFAFLTLHGYSFLQPAIAVLIWLGLISLGLFTGRPKTKKGAAAVSRNAPCPCGSGRKHKRCCGA